MDPLHLFEAKREIIFDITGSIGIMRQLYVIMKTISFGGDAQTPMPFHSRLLPVLIPFFLGAGADKELHLHLFELPHPEDKLTGDDLVAEGLADLSDPKGNLHP